MTEFVLLFLMYNGVGIGFISFFVANRKELRTNTDHPLVLFLYLVASLLWPIFLPSLAINTLHLNVALFRSNTLLNSIEEMKIRAVKIDDVIERENIAKVLARMEFGTRKYRQDSIDFYRKYLRS